MIFRNTIRLLLTNFSNVWKALLYYVVCIALTFGVCWVFASPIIEKLVEANIFENLYDVLNGFFSGIEASEVAESLNNTINTAWQVLTTNIQFKFNYIVLIVWVVFVFPFTLDLAQLALGEVLYGYMTSQVKYSFTGRYIKNIGKSSVYALIRYFVLLVFNVGAFLLLVQTIEFAAMGGILNVFLAFVLLCVLLCVEAFKHSLFSCWMPTIAVLNSNPFSALKRNFKCVVKKFFSIFSNYLALIIISIALNVMFCVFTLGVSLVFTLPLTAFVFVIFQMVSYFSSNGMRFYVYPDMFISPKRFEEQDKIKKLKYLV